MGTVFDVAAYILSKAEPDEGDGMTHLKLQKLVYYVQGFSLVLLGRPMFEEAIQAWDHGPVVPDLYTAYKTYGRGIIERPCGGGSPKALSDEERELIDDVYSVYGKFSAGALRNLTHSEAPWLDAYNKANQTITIEALKDFFPSLLTE